jgi:glycerol uptake facilitator-like aquaporin
LPCRLAAEAVGTAFLLAAIVGSGIMGERLASGNNAIALLANALATGAALIALILTFAPVSGAHFNPLVTLTMATRGDLPWRDVPGFALAQIVGALAGVIAAHLMFGEPLLTASAKIRSGWAPVFAEFVATFGLIGTIWAVSRTRPNDSTIAIAFAVAAYIVAAYWFTSSTSFANPAVTLARALTDTFSGIRPADVPGFLLGQVAGTIAAALFFSWLNPLNRPEP